MAIIRICSGSTNSDGRIKVSFTQAELLNNRKATAIILTNFIFFIVVVFAFIRKNPDLIHILPGKFYIEIFMLFLPIPGI